MGAAQELLSRGSSSTFPRLCAELCRHLSAQGRCGIHMRTSFCALEHPWGVRTLGAGWAGAGRTHLTLFRWSAAGSSRARPAGMGGPVGSGCCWKMSSGVKSTSVGLTMTLAADSRAVFPLL